MIFHTFLLMRKYIGRSSLLTAASLFSLQALAETPDFSYNWYEGSNTSNAKGVYGALDVPAGSNIPGARSSSVVSSGGVSPADFHVWLFGGNGVDSVGSLGIMNDLWEFNPATGDWTWRNGPDKNMPASRGNYGEQGVANGSNIPGARSVSSGWTDKNGNFWLFGGSGYDSTPQNRGYLNDLWKFDTLTHQWTWIKGSKIVNQIGNYGTQGTPNSANTPGARYSAATAVDSDGNLYLYGGYGFDFQYGAPGLLNDLWMYNITTNTWTWLSGSRSKNSSANYGELGVSNSSNTPGARMTSALWFDNHGVLWLFSGSGKDSTNASGSLNDVWSFDPVTKIWTWMNGSKLANQAGTYGTQGVFSPSNTPGGRNSSAFWHDSADNFWLLGGVGFDSIKSQGLLNDLWQYSTTSNQWIWHGGSSVVNSSGVWGALGVSSPSNVISSRMGAGFFTDTDGSFWLFGGVGKDVDQKTSNLNDLWKVTY